MILRIIKKFNSILTRHQKIRIVQLMGLMIVGAFVELLSVSMIMPFINSVMDPEKTMKKWYVQMICGWFHIEDPRVFMAVLAFVMAAIYVLKNLYLVFEKNIQNRFVYYTQFTFQKKLLHDFINRPYQYFLSVKSGEVMRMINSDVKQSFSLLLSLLSLATELIVSITLFVALLMMSAAITITIVIILLIMVAIISKFVKPVLRKAGKENQKTNARMHRWLLQSIHGIKEIKVSRREKYFEYCYDIEGKHHVDTLRISSVLNMVPKYLIEAVTMSSLFVLMGIFIVSGRDLTSLIPTLTVIAMAAIRLLSSANRISSAISDAAFKEPMLDRMIENLDIVDQHGKEKKIEEKNKNILPRPFKNEVHLKDVTYRYPEGEKNVLVGADMEVKRGMSIGIVGPSGAGKTTAVDIMLGLLEPQKGGVFVDDVNIMDDKKDWLRQISYIPQMIFMLDDTIRANVAFGFKEEKIDDEQVWKALDDASMKEYVESLPEGLETQIGERGVRLSGGQRQRIGIARALYRDPEILFFDEATSALDNATENAIMDSINKLHGRKTMVIIAHRLSTIEGCDVIYRVEDGTVTREK